MNTGEKPYTFLPNLKTEIASALEAAKDHKNIQGQAIYRDSVVKVLLFPFAAGQILHEHTTPHQATMHILSGKGTVTLGADKKEVEAGAWMMMPPSLPHSVHAETELVLLLQVFVGTGS